MADGQHDHHHFGHLPHLGPHLGHEGEHGIDHDVYLFRGGIRDGQLIRVADGLTRMFTMSDAPGLVDVYELIEERTPDPGHPGEDVGVFAYVGQEATGDRVPAELQHSPGEDAVPGDS